MRVTHDEERMKEVTILDSLTCDKCGKDMMYEHDPYNAYYSNWFEMRTGTDYPSYNFGIDYKLDLCEDCAKKLLALLILNDYKVYEKEWDW